MSPFGKAVTCHRTPHGGPGRAKSDSVAPSRTSLGTRQRRYLGGAAATALPVGDGVCSRGWTGGECPTRSKPVKVSPTNRMALLVSRRSPARRDARPKSRSKVPCAAKAPALDACARPRLLRTWRRELDFGLLVRPLQCLPHWVAACFMPLRQHKWWHRAGNLRSKHHGMPVIIELPVWRNGRRTGLKILGP